MSRQKIIFAFFAAVAAFLASCVWLYATYMIHNESKDWIPVDASVTANDADLGSYSTGRGQSGVVNKWETSVNYQYEGKRYSGVVNDYLVSSKVTVYVNPENATEVTGSRGPRVEEMFYPIVASVVSGLFALVMALIVFSPSDDQ